MFCPRCGTKQHRDARFCSTCGTAMTEHGQQVSVTKNRMSQAKPLKTIKPRLLTWVILASYLPIVINCALVGAAIGGTVTFFAAHLYMGWQFAIWQPFAYFAIGIFLLAMGIVYFIHRRTYDKTVYIFYDNHLEYAEGFWTVEKKIIKYAHITEVFMRRGIIQRLYGLGTIYLAVPAMAAKGGFAGVRLADLPNPQQVYEDIQDLLGK